MATVPDAFVNVVNRLSRERRKKPTIEIIGAKSKDIRIFLHQGYSVALASIFGRYIVMSQANFEAEVRRVYKNSIYTAKIPA